VDVERVRSGLVDDDRDIPAAIIPGDGRAGKRGGGAGISDSRGGGLEKLAAFLV
jgi:hypothetical protein